MRYWEGLRKSEVRITQNMTFDDYNRK
jgi:hypothetical protein